MSMKYKEYKQSVSDIRALINNRGRLRSKFGAFPIRHEIFGIWNCLSENVIVVINQKNKTIRVRRNSVYRPALSALDGWKTIISDSLSNYRGAGMNNHMVIYINHLARPQQEAINLNPPEFKLNLGKNEKYRPAVLDYLLSKVTNQYSTEIKRILTEPKLKRYYKLTRPVDKSVTIDEILAKLDPIAPDSAIPDTNVVNSTAEELGDAPTQCGDPNCTICRAEREYQDMVRSVNNRGRVRLAPVEEVSPISSETLRMMNSIWVDEPDELEL